MLTRLCELLADFCFAPIKPNPIHHYDLGEYAILRRPNSPLDGFLVYVVRVLDLPGRVYTVAPDVFPARQLCVPLHQTIAEGSELTPALVGLRHTAQ